MTEKDKTTDALLPCPFCDGDAYIDSIPKPNWGIDRETTVWVECRTCGATNVPSRKEEHAITTWNTRVSTPTPASSDIERKVKEIWKNPNLTYSQAECEERNIRAASPPEGLDYARINADSILRFENKNLTEQLTAANEQIAALRDALVRTKLDILSVPINDTAAVEHINWICERIQTAISGDKREG